jgi:hypothetical protein
LREAEESVVSREVGRLEEAEASGEDVADTEPIAGQSPSST